MGPLPFKPDNSDDAAQPSPDACGGVTRVTFHRGNHRFEFKCDPGSEAALARAVLDLARREGSPLEPGDAFALVRQIESMAPAGPNSASAGGFGPAEGDAGPRKRAA